jgi:hypothetical protein
MLIFVQSATNVLAPVPEGGVLATTGFGPY